MGTLDCINEINPSIEVKQFKQAMKPYAGKIFETVMHDLLNGPEWLVMSF